MKADVPRRTRVVSEQEQAKTDSRRMVRTAQHASSASTALFSLHSILFAVVYSLQSTVYSLQSTLFSHSSFSINLRAVIILYCMSIGQVKGREYDQAGSR